MSKRVLKKATTGFLSVIMALTMMLGVVGGTGFDSKAADGPGTLTISSAVLTKELTVPTGAKEPSVIFSYTATGLGYETATGAGEIQTGTSGHCPPWTVPSIEFDGSLTAASDKVERSVDILTSLKALGFTHAGVFVYEVIENAPTGADASKVSTSPAKYRVKVYVKNVSGSDTLEVAGITVNQDIDNSSAATGVKVNPEPAITHSAFRYISNYLDTTEVTITKEVAGDYADKTLAFPFIITIKVPTNIAANTKINYSPTNTNAPTGTSITVQPGDTKTLNFSLSHGESIEFADMPVGSTYTVTENPVLGTLYSPSAAVKEGGVLASSVTVASGKVTINDGRTDVNDILAGNAGDNEVAITNTHTDPSVTGILIDNIPWIALIAAVVVGFVLFVVSRKNRRVR